MLRRPTNDPKKPQLGKISTFIDFQSLRSAPHSWQPLGQTESLVCSLKVTLLIELEVLRCLVALQYPCFNGDGERFGKFVILFLSMTFFVSNFQLSVSRPLFSFLCQLTDLLAHCTLRFLGAKPTASVKATLRHSRLHKPTGLARQRGVWRLRGLIYLRCWWFSTFFYTKVSDFSFDSKVRWKYRLFLLFCFDFSFRSFWGVRTGFLPDDFLMEPDTNIHIRQRYHHLQTCGHPKRW